SGAGNVTGQGTTTAVAGVATRSITGSTVGQINLTAAATLTQGSTTSNTLAVTVNLAPTVTSTNPNSKSKNASYTGIKILGTNFQNGATVSFSGGGITVTG